MCKQFSRGGQKEKKEIYDRQDIKTNGQQLLIRLLSSAIMNPEAMNMLLNRLSGPGNLFQIPPDYRL